VKLGYLADPALSLGEALLVALIAYIGVAFTEEILCRGYLQLNLGEGLSGISARPWVGVGLAMIFSSVLFGLPHGGNPHATLTSTLLLCLLGIFSSLGEYLPGNWQSR
jgi:membrane protease YdiL (CAAX protease family)